MRPADWLVRGEVRNPAVWLAAGAGLACAGGLLRSQYERNHFVTETVEITSEKIREEKTLVFLSDLHNKEFGPGNERLLAEIRRISPDLILIGGDTMVAKKGSRELGPVRRLLAGLAPIAPVYYGNGNHEQRLKKEIGVYGDCYRQFVSLLAEMDVVYLPDRSVCVGTDLRISGLDLEPMYYKDRTRAKMTAAHVARHLGPASEDRFQILMAHSPLFFDAYRTWGADLSLAGHFHGGTVRLPFLGGVMTPQLQFFLPWCAGTFQQDNKTMIVSRGLGTHSINIRFHNQPQILQVILRPPLHG